MASCPGNLPTGANYCCPNRSTHPGPHICVLGNWLNQSIKSLVYRGPHSYIFAASVKSTRALTSSPPSPAAAAGPEVALAVRPLVLALAGAVGRIRRLRAERTPWCCPTANRTFHSFTKMMSINYLELRMDRHNLVLHQGQLLSRLCKTNELILSINYELGGERTVEQG